jgi:3-hydroxybutyryl-CoA dehydratase
MTTNGTLAARALVEGLEVQEAFVSPGRTITETDLVSFAALTGDWHPQHSDASWAADSRFGGRIAHGMLVLSYAIGLAPLDPSRVVALRRLSDVVFKRPVHIGDTIRVESRVEAIKPLDADSALVDLGWNILNHGDETVARARIYVVWRRASGEAAHPGNEPERAEPQLEEVFL